MVEPGISREGNGLLLDRGIDVDTLKVFLGHVFFALCRLDGHLEQLLHSPGADPLSPLYQGSRIERELMLEVLEAAKILPVTVLDELLHYSLVAHVVSMLEVVEANEEPNRQARTPEVLDVQGAKFSVKERPVNGIRQAVQRTLTVKDLIQPGAEQIALV